MSMTLDEAIKYVTDLAGETEEGKVYQQLGDWLKELKRRREEDPEYIYVLTCEWHNDSTPRKFLYKTEEQAKRDLRRLIQDYGVDRNGKCLDMDGRTIDECVEDGSYCAENADCLYVERVEVEDID